MDDLIAFAHEVTDLGLEVVWETIDEPLRIDGLGHRDEALME